MKDKVRTVFSPDVRDADMSLQELLLARQWLDAALGLVSPSSANRYGRMLRARLSEVDIELWGRLVDSEDCPWSKRDAGQRSKSPDAGDPDQKDPA
jgi:hypothetical protein